MLEDMKTESASAPHSIGSMTDLACLAARGLGKWTLYLSFDWEYDAEIVKAAPILQDTYKNRSYDLTEGFAVLWFDSEEEARQAFGSTVGDDGPTRTNPYDGPALVYALLISPEGRMVTENT